jgi:hypothetical protein
MRSFVPMLTKSKWRKKDSRTQRCGRHFDHGAQLDSPIGAPASVKLLPGRASASTVSRTSLRCATIGNEDPHLAEGTGAQDGTKLLPEHAGSDRLQRMARKPKRRIQHVLVPQFGHAHPLKRLVGSDVDRADRHRQALHRLATASR